MQRKAKQKKLLQKAQAALLQQKQEIAAIEKPAIQEIEKVTATPTSKEAARAEIDALAEAQTELIDNNKLLTDKEKEAAKDAIQKAAELAKSKIDNSDDNSAVDTAKTQGIILIYQMTKNKQLKMQLTKLPKLLRMRSMLQLLMLK